MSGPISRELYADYLQSEEWASRRERVLERAGGTCEGCRGRPATEVHHLTYEHVTREFLFELVAICGACHALTHDAPARPTVSHWTPRKTDRPQVSPSAQKMQGQLNSLAVIARAKFMAAGPPKPPPPMDERTEALARKFHKADALEDEQPNVRLGDAA